MLLDQGFSIRGCVGQSDRLSRDGCRIGRNTLRFRNHLLSHWLFVADARIDWFHGLSDFDVQFINRFQLGFVLLVMTMLAALTFAVLTITLLAVTVFTTVTMLATTTTLTMTSLTVLVAFVVLAFLHVLRHFDIEFFVFYFIVLLAGVGQFVFSLCKGAKA